MLGEGDATRAKPCDSCRKPTSPGSRDDEYRRQQGCNTRNRQPGGRQYGAWHSEQPQCDCCPHRQHRETQHAIEHHRSHDHAIPVIPTEKIDLSDVASDRGGQEIVEKCPDEVLPDG